MNSSLDHLRSNFRTQLESEAGTLRGLVEKADQLRIEIVPNTADDRMPPVPVEGAIDSVIVEATLNFPDRARALHRCEQAEQAFCATHNLQNKAANPNPVVSALLIFIGVFVDAFVNSSFLFNAHLAASPSAALLVSVLISLTNGVTSAFAGFFIGRYRNYGIHAVDSDASEFASVRKRANKQFKVFLGVMAFFILTVGLIRSTESLDFIHHSLQNYQELLVTPEAVFLMLINICVSVFSYYKGRTGFAHPYGEYSDYQNGIAAAHDDLHKCYTGHVEAIEDIC